MPIQLLKDTGHQAPMTLKCDTPLNATLTVLHTRIELHQVLLVILSIVNFKSSLVTPGRHVLLSQWPSSHNTRCAVAHCTASSQPTVWLTAHRTQCGRQREHCVGAQTTAKY